MFVALELARSITLYATMMAGSDDAPSAGAPCRPPKCRSAGPRASSGSTPSSFMGRRHDDRVQGRPLLQTRDHDRPDVRRCGPPSRSARAGRRADRGMSMMPALFDLTGKVAVITGSSRGIGQSIAEQMAMLGAKVVVSSRKPDACEPVAQGIRDRGGEAVVIGCNISNRDDVEGLIEGTRRHYGGLDIVVCNAAVNPYYGPLANMPDEAFDKIMASQRQVEHLAGQSRGTAHGGARWRRDHHRLVDRRHSRHWHSRRLRHLQGGGLRACAQPRRGTRAQERPRQLYRARPCQDGVRTRFVGKTRSSSGIAKPRRLCAASVCPTRSAGSRRSSPRRQPASLRADHRGRWRRDHRLVDQASAG